MDSLMATAASPEDGGTSGASVAAMAEVKTISNTSALNYVVNSYIYHEAPDRMIVTCRGEKGGKPALWKVPYSRNCMACHPCRVDIDTAAVLRVAALVLKICLWLPPTCT